MIEVVSAVIIRYSRDRRILLTQRRVDKPHYPLCWESPGGKVGRGETHDEALRRELDEELGVKSAVINHPLYDTTFDGAKGIDEPFKITMYLVGFDDAPRPCEGQGIGWFTEMEMRSLLLTPGNARAAVIIGRTMKGERL